MDFEIIQIRRMGACFRPLTSPVCKDNNEEHCFDYETAEETQKVECLGSTSGVRWDFYYAYVLFIFNTVDGLRSYRKLETV